MYRWALICLIVGQVCAYAIQGSWLLTSLQQTQLAPNESVNAEIRNFIFRNSTIRYTIEFSGCRKFKYMMDIDGKNIYIDAGSYFLQSNNQGNCIDRRVNLERRAETLLTRTFTFQIIQQFMIFSDPFGSVLLKFQRVSNDKPINISGTWAMSNPGNSNFQLTEINDRSMFFCQKQAQIDYKIVQKNKMSFFNFLNNGCANTDFIQNMQNSKYAVRRGNYTVQLYNENDDLLLTLKYSSAKMNDISARPANQPMENLGASSVPNIPLPVPIMAGNFSDLIGKWPIAQVLTSPNVVNNSQFIVSNSTMILSLNCSTLILGYSLVSPNPIKIKVQNFREIPGTCQDKNEVQYKTALSKIQQFDIKLQTNKMVVDIYDKMHQHMFQLQKPMQFRAPLSENTMAPSYSVVPSQPVQTYQPPPQINPILNGIQPGKYTVLLLQRRDLARKIINIQNNSFTLTICNTIKFTFTIGNSKALSISAQIQTSNNCDTSIQSLYVNEFKNAAKYSLDDLDIFLQNGKGQDSIALNFVA